MNKKNIFLWTLYDFANSIAIVVFSVYFAEWLVVDRHVADIWFNVAFAGATVLLLASAPVLGIIADKTRNRMVYLRWLTVLFFLALLGISFLAIYLPQKIFLILLLFTLANYFYQFSFSFYNPLLHDIAASEKQGFVSGLGQMANWLGEIGGLLLTLPIIAGAVVLFAGSATRAQTFLPASTAFFLLSLPMLFWFKDPIKKIAAEVNIAREYKNYWQELKLLLKKPGIARFLVGYFLFNDAVLTGSNNFAIYLEQVFKVPDQTKTYLLLGILLTSALGALVTGWVADKIGLKKSLLVVLVGWVITFPLLGILSNFVWFSVATILMGFLFGAIWTVARAVMAYLAPTDKLNHAFSYYTMFERFSSLVGPITWVVITSVIFHTGALRYKVAISSMSIFIVLGLIAVWKIPTEKSSGA